MNKNLHAAKNNKKDEFYTRITDIEKELRHYKDHFEGKIVLCNCDDPTYSNFVIYLALCFEPLKLKKVISTHYEPEKSSYKIEITKHIKNIEELNTLPRIPLQGDGDFRSPECIELLKEADIVTTNPPFSLFREYISQLIEYNKKFLIIGHQNAITYKEIFPLIKENKLWLGYGFSGGAAHFINRNYEDYAAANDHKEGMIRVSGVHWFTNLPHNKRNEKLILFRNYYGNEKVYPKYDNYDAIEVSKVCDIPQDYQGVMGVPITFLDKYNPKQFDLIGSNRGVDQDPNGIYGKGSLLNGKETFKRLFIRRR